MSICKKPYNRVQQEVKSRKVNREIYPCPECGGSGKITYVGDRKLYPIVRCSDCGHEESRFHEVALSENWAIDIWNERIMYRK